MELQEEVKKLKKIPKLTIIQVGNYGPSNKYVSQKIKVGTSVGIEVEHINFDEEVLEEDVIKKINELNEDENVNGIMVQLPLPNHLNE